jgi:hypothetical protein
MTGEFDCGLGRVWQMGISHRPGAVVTQTPARNACSETSRLTLANVAANRKRPHIDGGALELRSLD